MKTKRLTEVLDRVETWPADAQNALADFARDIEASLTQGDYVPTPEELAGIDRGLRSPLATDEEVERAFAKLRSA